MLEGFLGATAKEIDQAERFLGNKRRLVEQLPCTTAPSINFGSASDKRHSLDSRSKPRRDELHPNVPLDLCDELRPRLHCQLIRHIEPVAVNREGP